MEAMVNQESRAPNGEVESPLAGFAVLCLRHTCRSRLADKAAGDVNITLRLSGLDVE